MSATADEQVALALFEIWIALARQRALDTAAAVGSTKRSFLKERDELGERLGRCDETLDLLV
jgi:hypothetical protein